MEGSSPLAAMHRPQLPQPWAAKDPFITLPRAAGTGGVAPGLRERLQKTNAAFLSIKDLRGSSPAASLAVDMSQNFNLDNNSSPRFPTPRRNLFSAASMMQAGANEFITTPAPLCSSPLDTVEMMEESPVSSRLPEAPEDVEIISPTPPLEEGHHEITGDENGELPTHDDEMLLDSPAFVARKTSFEGPRRRARRPSLSRMKGFTTSVVHGRGAYVDNQLPTFRFGDSRMSIGSSSGSSTDSYDSPLAPHEKRPQTANGFAAGVAGPVRSRAQLLGGAGVARLGSPLNGHARRTSNPFFRNRKQIRRSLSMFEHPEDVMKPKPEASPVVATKALEAVMDVEEAQELVLPHFPADDPCDTIPRISKETLVEVLDGKYEAQFTHKMIIDCRFEYEYEGGHIDGAINYNDKELLATHLFQTPMDGRTLIIFHCEYSAHRAPLMARHIRSEDRNVNAEHYPRLTYPDVYILSGGYSEFFLAHMCRCYPQNYVEMSDEKHQRTCERELSRLKARKPATFGRAKTFAFETLESESPFPKHRSMDDFSLGSPAEIRRTRVITL